MNIALCICTRNRPEELRNCLKAVYEGTIRPAEVFVSDDSTEEKEARAVTAEFAGAVYQRGPCRGLGPNRNSCIQRCTETHIMFIDDDVRVSREFFETAHQIIQQADAHVIVTGCQIDHIGGSTQQFTPHNADFWGLQRVPVRDEYRSVVMNAAIFPRTLFEQAKFDERVRYGSEEIDMARHAVALGFKIAFCENLCVDHYPSSANRVEYTQYTEASRLYVTTKAYWLYEHSLPKTFAYALLAPLQLVGSAMRQQDWPKVQTNLRSVFLASKYLYKSILEAKRS